MNINLAASIARLIFRFKEMAEYQKQKKSLGTVAKVSRVVLQEAVRAAAKKKKLQEPPSERLGARYHCTCSCMCCFCVRRKYYAQIHLRVEQSQIVFRKMVQRRSHLSHW